MRTFIYAMPSSGATFVAWTMSQSPRTIGLLDMCQGEIPEPRNFPPRFDVVLKDTVGSDRPYNDWLRIFKPDRVVIVTRDLARVEQSLVRRYCESGHPIRFLRRGAKSIRRLARMLSAEIRRNSHDEIVRYEDVAASDPDLSRPLMDIAVQNHLHCRWCRNNAIPARWAFGGICVDGMSKVEGTFLYRVVRYYGEVLSGARKWRRVFVGTEMYVPSRR
jgi:hypothetical protein